MHSVPSAESAEKDWRSGLRGRWDKLGLTSVMELLWMGEMRGIENPSDCISIVIASRRLPGGV